MTAPDEYPRDEWLAALYTHGPRGAPRRAVARVFADYARGDQTWVLAELIEQRTGLGRSTVYYAIHGRPATPARAGRRAERAVPGLIELGWLTPLTKRRQHYSPRYRLTVPEVPERIPEVPERTVPEVPERIARGPGADPRGPGADARGPGADARGPGAGPDTNHTPATPPTPAPTAGRDMADALLVVVGSKGLRPDRRVTVRECQQLAEQWPAWTPDLLADAARRHEWNGARPGAVISWIRGLEDPEPPPVTSATSSALTEKCPIHGVRRSLAGACSGCESDRKAGQ